LFVWVIKIICFAGAWKLTAPSEAEDVKPTTVVRARNGRKKNQRERGVIERKKQGEFF